MPELIDRYTNGDLTGDELTSFIELLKNNRRLREEVILDRELNEFLSNHDILELQELIISIKKEKQRQKSRRQDLYVILLAASLLLLLGIEIVLNLNQEQTDRIKNTTMLQKVPQKNKKVESATERSVGDKNQKNVLTPKAEGQLAEVYKPNPSFEKMIGVTRGADQFKMISPIPGSHLNEKQEIIFEWLLPRNSGVELMILNNQGSSIYKSGLLVKNNYSLQRGMLKIGLYYYKIIQNEEIVFFGKFYVY